MRLASRLKHYIAIEKCSEIGDDSGGFEENWTLYKNCWAEIKPIQGSEKFAMMQNENIITHRITIRYLSDINPKHRINFGGRIFATKSIICPFEAKQTLQILAEEQL